MERTAVVRGRLHGRRIDLDEPLDQPDGEVEIAVRSVAAEPAKTVESVFDFIRSLPPGTRTKEDIDAQIAEEHESWGER